jgi:hypothetical protein
VRPAISSHTGFPPNRPSRVRQPKPSARELPPARRSNTATPPNRRIQGQRNAPWSDDGESSWPSNRFLWLHLNPTTLPSQFGQIDAVSERILIKLRCNKNAQIRWAGRRGASAIASKNTAKPLPHDAHALFRNPDTLMCAGRSQRAGAKIKYH